MFKQLVLLGLLLLPSMFSHALVVLQYHHIDTRTPAITSTRPEIFKEHLELLAAEEMPVLNFLQALKNLEAGKPLPEKAVAITFDDAYLSIYEQAWPLLKARGWTFTIFVNPQQIDNKVKNMMSWEQLLELQQHGVTIANHSQTHPYLIEHDEPLDVFLEREINGAEQRLKEMLGTSHKLFAYPYGEFNLPIMNWLAEQGYYGVGQHSGAIGATTHPQALPRYPAGGVYANPKTLISKLYTLPFAIAPQEFKEQVLAQNNPPTLSLALPIEDFLPRQVQCYSGSEGALNVMYEVQDTNLHLTTQAKKEITSGRDRYNCTAPSLSKPGWFYWYSQPWVNTAVKKR